MVKSPLAQAEARTLALEDENSAYRARLATEENRGLALERERDVLRQERDDANDTLARMAAHLGHEISSEYTHAHLLDDVVRMVRESDGPSRWEVGFRNIVTRIHGARKDFDIPEIVGKVSAVFEAADALAEAIEHAADLRESADFLRERIEELREMIEEPWKVQFDDFNAAVREMANRRVAFDELYGCTEYARQLAMFEDAHNAYQEARRG